MNRKINYSLYLIILVLALTSCKNRSQKSLFVVGGYTNESNASGLHMIEVDFKAMTAKVLSSSSEVQNPSYFIFSKNKNSLYAVCENSNYKGEKTGSVARFLIEKNKFSLKEETSSGGYYPCYLSLMPRYNRVMIANYGSGNVGSVDLDSEGHLTDDLQVISHYNSNTNNARQEKSHLHFVMQSPWSKNIAFSVDLGGDKIYKYQIDRILKVVDSVSLPQGSGPRHLAFHAKGRWAYSANELNSTVSLLRYDKSNGLEYIKSYSTLKKKDEKNYCAGIQIDAQGKHLYVSNRGKNTISCFDIDPKTGGLTLKYETSVLGNWPRFFTLTEDGQYMLVANQKSNNITFFRINQRTGEPKKINLELEINSPTCILQR